MTDLAITENDLQTYDEYIDSLEHHGILGMKWGYQNGPPYPLDAGDHSDSERKAGWRKSLSSAASGVATAAKKTKAAIQVAKAKHDEKKQIKEEKKAQKKIEDKNEAVKSGDPLKIAEYSSKMSIQEYREAVDRLDLQRRLNMYLPPDKAKLTMGEKLDRARQGVDKFATNVQNGINTYNKVARLTNTLFKTELPVLDKPALERAAEKAKEEREREVKFWKEQKEIAVNKQLIATSRNTIENLNDQRLERQRAKSAQFDSDWNEAIKENNRRDAEKKAAEQFRRDYERDWNEAHAENERRNAEALKSDYERNVSALNEATSNRHYAEVDKQTAIDHWNYYNKLSEVANDPAPIFSDQRKLDSKYYNQT